MKESFEKIILFYFSGTGNAHKAAEWFCEIAKNEGFNCEIVAIHHALQYDFTNLKNSLIGIFGPTHGFNFPPLILDFVFSLPKSKNNKAIILNTRAGMKLYKLFLPGLSGAAQFFTALILKFKKYQVVGMQPLDMPSNWISIHPGLRPKVVLSIVKRCQRKTQKFAEKIIHGKKSYIAFYSTPFDLAILPISVLYYFLGRFALAKTFFASSKCNNCGLCEKNCPVNAIKTIGNRKFWTYQCESCMKCLTQCPEHAIHTSHAYTISLWIMIYSFILPFFVNFFTDFSFFNTKSVAFQIIDFFAEGFIFIGISILLYRIFHYLLRFKIFSLFNEYTSLTRYWRNYNLKKIIRKNQSVV